MKENTTATPSANEVAAIHQVIEVLSSKGFTFEQALQLIPHLESAIKEIAFKQEI